MRVKFDTGVLSTKWRNRCSHGPQNWRRRLWLPGFSIVKLGVVAPSTGWRLWIYTQWAAFNFDVYFDRRKQPA